VRLMRNASSPTAASCATTSPTLLCWIRFLAVLHMAMFEPDIFSYCGGANDGGAWAGLTASRAILHALPKRMSLVCLSPARPLPLCLFPSQF
jgi:hypothetical protein